MTDIALLTDSRYTAETAAPDDWYLGNILRDDGLLRADLASRGLSSVRVDWADPTVDWSAFRAAVFRTTWDYYDRAEEFAAFVERLQAQTYLINDFSTIVWNLDKHYLSDLEKLGLPIVPTRYIERDNDEPLLALLEATGWDEAIIKPCISGGARHTHRVNRQTAVAIDRMLATVRAAEAFLLQPFQESIATMGEDSLMLFGGRYSHAVRKIAKAGDFRVQDDHGGRAIPHLASPEQIELAERIVATARPGLPYARVDLVRNNTGGYAVMELELIEPELWIRTHPPSAALMAQAINDTLVTAGLRG